MTEYQTHTALVQSLEAEVSRLRAINAEPKGIIEAGIKPNNSLVQAARQALEALLAATPLNAKDLQMQVDAIDALREALEAAPQPARQPLTDKQIQDIWCSARIDANQHGPFWFAHAIERAHGIGGEA